MLTILQGDDTAANMRTIAMRLPEEDIGGGYTVVFSICGVERRGEYAPGGAILFDFTRDETAAFPLGISYATVKLEKDGLMQTITNTLPVKITDSVAEALAAANGGNGGSKNAITLSVGVNTGLSQVEKSALTSASTVGDVKELVNAIRSSVNGAATAGG